MSTYKLNKDCLPDKDVRFWLKLKQLNQIPLHSFLSGSGKDIFRHDESPEFDTDMQDWRSWKWEIIGAYPRGLVDSTHLWFKIASTGDPLQDWVHLNRHMKIILPDRIEANESQ